MKKQTRVLGTFSLAMITIAAIVSLRNLPVSVPYGLSSITFYVAAALLFFIPTALVTAELATGWPKAGGNYVWVGEAFGSKWGFLALWSAWLESIAWFPAILAFIAAMLAHLLHSFFPGLEHNKWFYLITMLSIFWGATFLNFKGIEVSSWVSSLGVLAGTIIPGALIIGLGAWWVLSDQISHMVFQWSHLIPNLQLNNLVFFSGIVLGLAGAELAVFHILEAKDPQRTYPRALVLASIVILSISILGTLAIAVVVPAEKINLLSGLLQAFEVFFNAFHWAWMVPFVAVLLLIGSLAGINTWIVGPAKGLLVAAEDGYLPLTLRYINSRGVPSHLLILQACIGSILSCVFLLLEDNSASYWVLTALSSQFAVIQYLFVFLAALRLRYSQWKMTRAFRVPGGKTGMWLVAGLGMIACVFSLIIAFVPPPHLKPNEHVLYQTLLGTSLIVLLSLPIIFIWQRNKSIRLRELFP